MSAETHIKTHLYSNIGKLFYAIAASDKHVKVEEHEKLIELLGHLWSHHTEEKYLALIIKTFYTLKQEKVKPDVCFNAFLTFKNTHDNLFPEDLKTLILKTASLIANSFASTNKSELIMLATLDISFK